MNYSRLILRAHTIAHEKKKKHKRNGPRKQKGQNSEPKWPDCIVIFDCETRIDENQALTFGSYRVVCVDENGQYNNVRDEGLFYDPDELTPTELETLKQFRERHRAETANDVSSELHLRTRQEFLRAVFLPLGLKGAMLTAFNLTFDTSRIAFDVQKARRVNDDWSFEMLDEPFCPRIIVTRKDGKIAFFRFSGVKFNHKTRKKIRIPRGRFLDVRTLAWALRNVGYSLKSLCKDLKIKGKLNHKPSGKVTEEEIAYARQDVRATLGALNVLRKDFERFPIDLPPDQAYSPASIVKAHFAKIGLTPPLQKFPLSPKIQGIGAQAFNGGRAECRIRCAALPVEHVDFKSEYPTAIVLMGTWKILTAARLRIASATKRIRKLVEKFNFETAFDQRLWKEFPCFALVEPDADVLPLRTVYDPDSDDSNAGVNVLSSKAPIWYALPDLLASRLLTGKAPKILSAFQLISGQCQPNLKSIALGDRKLRPRSDDFFRMVIENRELLKKNKTIQEPERKALGYFLKIMANSGYGVFIETTPKLSADRVKTRVYSGQSAFPTTSDIVEDKGPWYSPLIASLVTSAGRLFLAMLETAVAREGGTYVFTDTDSMAIVATRSGGTIPCPGGAHRSPDGAEAVKALSWDQVQQIIKRFNQLNPYDRKAVPSILKIEDVNYENGDQREIFCYAISAKRYAFFQRIGSAIQIIKVSEHGLGHLFVPGTKFDKPVDAPGWVVATWRYLINRALGIRSSTPNFFGIPAMMKLAITTPDVLKVLQKREHEEGLPYRSRVKPFNFIQTPLINRQVFGHDPETNETIRLGYPLALCSEHFTLIASFTEDTSRWYKIPYTNVHDGRWFYIAPLPEKQSFEASPYTLDDVILMYETHPESKSLAPDGLRCGPHTVGLLQRTAVTVTGFDYIGKESDRKWEHEGDLSRLFPTLPVYHKGETARKLQSAAIRDRVRLISIRRIANLAHVSTRTIRAVRAGKRIRKSTAKKIENALRNLGID